MSARVGVDLGATAVRVVEVNGLNKDSFAQITRAAVVATPAGAIVSGRIKDPTAVAWALSRALDDAGISSYGVILGLSSPDTAISRVVMPGALRRDEWNHALRTGDKPISPKIPVGKSAMSLYELSENIGEDGTVATRTLLAAAALEDEVRLVQHVCREAKVTPRAIDLAGAATMRSITRSVQGNEDVATLVDIGSSKITVATRQGLHLRSLRTIEGGGDRITKSIMGVTGGSYDQAEDLKLSMRLAPTEQARRQAKAAQIANQYGSVEETKVHDHDETDVALESMTTSAEQLIDDIAAAIESDAANHPSAPTQGILLCGGTSLLRGLKDRLVQRVGVPGAVGRPWATVIPSKKTEHLLVDGTEDSVMLMSLATAVGLALWKESH